MDAQHIIIFDGICAFCNGSVNFIIKRDPERKFICAPAQSATAQSLIHKYGADAENLKTLLLIKNGKCYRRTNAAFEIAKNLTGFWFLLNVFKIVPETIRDYIYDLFARHRYRLFGKRKMCMVPDLEIRDRFLTG